MQIARLIVIAGIAALILVMLIRVSPGKSKLQLSGDADLFPVVSGFNLERREFVFPRDFEGEHNLVLIPFQRYQQELVDTWIPAAQQIEAEFPGFIYYELPTLTGMSTLYRTFLNEGMRAGIPDQTARQRTITLYLDKEMFKNGLDIPSENDIYLFLVDRDGKILWRMTGEYTPEKTSELIKVLEQQR